MSRKILLEVKNLKQYFPLGRKSVVKAVDDVSFHIYEGETFGLITFFSIAYSPSLTYGANVEITSFVPSLASIIPQ